MRARRDSIATLFSLALWCTTGHDAHAAERTASSASLRGLPSVRVVVEQLGPKIEGKGITRQQLQSDVEDQLRQAALVDVAPDAPALLYANVSIVCDASVCAYNINLEIQQPVRLQTRPDAGPMPAATWSTGTTGFLRRVQAIRLTLREQVEQFLRAYAVANSS